MRKIESAALFQLRNIKKRKYTFMKILKLLTLSVSKKLKNSFFDISIFPKITSGTSFILDIIRTLTEDSLKKVPVGSYRFIEVGIVTHPAGHQKQKG